MMWGMEGPDGCASTPAITNVITDGGAGRLCGGGTDAGMEAAAARHVWGVWRVSGGRVGYSRVPAPDTYRASIPYTVSMVWRVSRAAAW